MLDDPLDASARRQAHVRQLVQLELAGGVGHRGIPLHQLERVTDVAPIDQQRADDCGDVVPAERAPCEGRRPEPNATRARLDGEPGGPQHGPVEIAGVKIVFGGRLGSGLGRNTSSLPGGGVIRLPWRRSARSGGLPPAPQRQRPAPPRHDRRSPCVPHRCPGRHRRRRPPRPLRREGRPPGRGWRVPGRRSQRRPRLPARLRHGRDSARCPRPCARSRSAGVEAAARSGHGQRRSRAPRQSYAVPGLSGTGNVFRANVCATSVPDGPC
jgi:hypothetical protein